MKRDDLFTKLHDQYNTYQSSIQDPYAFYHDVFEISHEASSVAEFHYLICNRKYQRLCELNEALEFASLEIIGSPNLINTPQWECAVQLFRTNSLDSLVQFFTSYLSIDHHCHPTRHANTPNSGSIDITPNLPAGAILSAAILPSTEPDSDLPTFKNAAKNAYHGE